MPMLSSRSRSRRGATEGTVTSTAGVDLPPYEPLSCALSEEAKRALLALGNGRDTRRYEDHIKKSVNYIGKNVAALNDRLLERQAEFDTLVEKRTAKGTEKSAREEQLESWIPKLEAEVHSLSMNSESAMRDLVDRQAKLQDDTAATAAMAAHFQSLPSGQRPARRRQTDAEGGEDADEAEPEELPPPEQDPITVLEEQRLAKYAKYEELDYYRKYSLNNDYAAFRKLWHDARFGDKEELLPDPSQWIDAEGNPVLVEKQRAGDNDAEDEDLVIEGEHHSYVCPLSMQQITEPFSNKKCRHTFQKQSIVQWFNEPGYRGRSRQCPEPGCEASFSLADFFYDDLVMRKIQRTRKREAQEEASDQEDDEDDEEIQRATKREAKEQASGQEDDEEEEEDVDVGPRQSTDIKVERKRKAVEAIEDDEEE